MKLGRIFYFDAAHHLPDYKGECEKYHGHTYRLEIVLEDAVKKDGMIMDFKDFKEAVSESVLEKLDHQDLNRIVKNPTAENIVEWIWSALEKKIPLDSIKLWEGEGKWVEKTKR